MDIENVTSHACCVQTEHSNEVNNIKMYFQQFKTKNVPKNSVQQTIAQWLRRQIATYYFGDRRQVILPSMPRCPLL